MSTGMVEKDIPAPAKSARYGHPWLIALLAGALLLLAAGYWIHYNRIDIAHALLDRALLNQPASITSLSGLNAGTHRATIDSISVLLSEPPVEITLNQVELTYTWSSLLARRPETVRVNEMRADFSPGADSGFSGTLLASRITVECGDTDVCHIVIGAGGSLSADIPLPDASTPTPLQLRWPEPIRASWVSATRFTGTATLIVAPLSLPSWPLRSMPVRMELAASRTDDVLTADTSLELPAGQTLLVNAQHHLATHRGEGQFTTDGMVFTDLLPLSAIFSLPQDTDIIAGQLAAQAQLTWQRSAGGVFALHGPIDVQAQNISGFIDETVFTRLGVYMKTELLPDWQLRTREPGSAALTAIDPGLELEYLSTRFSFDTSAATVVLIRPQFTVFDGIVSTDQINWRPDTPDQFEVQLQDIDIARILGLSAYQQVQATGLMNGSLPVELINWTPVINDGKVSAESPGGTIRYQGGRFGGINQNMELVHQALQRYDYSALDATINYSATGDLALDIRLQGISPLLNNGQRINLNLTVADNVPELLRSLQAGRSVQDALSDHLQRR